MLIEQFEKLDGVFRLIKQSWDFLISVIQVGLSSIETTINVILDGFKQIADVMRAIPGTTVADIMRDLSAVVTQIITDISNKIQQLIDRIKNRFPTAFSIVQTGFEALVTAINTIITPIINILDTLISKVREFVDTILSLDLSELVAQFSGLKDRIIEELSGLGEFFKNIFVDSFKSGIDRLKELNPVNRIKRLFGFGEDQETTENVRENITRLVEQPTTPANTPFPGFNPAGIYGPGGGQQPAGTNQVQNINGGPITINIDGAQNPEIIANEIQKVLKQSAFDLVTPVSQ